MTPANPASMTRRRLCASLAVLPGLAAVAPERWTSRNPRAAHNAGVLGRRLLALPGVAAIAAARGHEVPDLIGSERVFRDRKRDDFVAGRVVRIDGWMMAEAEVLLLVALADA